MDAQGIIVVSLVLQLIATWRMFSVAAFAGRAWLPFLIAWGTIDAGLIARPVMELQTAVLNPGDNNFTFGTWLTLFNSVATAVSIEAFRFCLLVWLHKRQAKGPLSQEEASLLARLRRK